MQVSSIISIIQIQVFALLECSPNLQSLNLSYNPLRHSTLFCEADKPNDVTVQRAEVSTASSLSSLEFNVHPQVGDSNDACISLLDEISFCEEERNESVGRFRFFASAVGVFPPFVEIYNYFSLGTWQTNLCSARPIRILPFIPLEHSLTQFNTSSVETSPYFVELPSQVRFLSVSSTLCINKYGIHASYFQI